MVGGYMGKVLFIDLSKQEVREETLITKQDTDGIELTWGNHQAIVAMTEKIAKREGFGAVLADGSKVAVEKIGNGAKKYAMHVHGREVPNADPRYAPSAGVTYVTGANPADLTSGGAEWAEMGGGIPMGLELPPIKRLTYTGKGQVHALLRKCFHLMDAAGFCTLGRHAIPFDALTQQLAAVTGWERPMEELLKVGERISCLCQAFNVREGLKPSDIELPPRIAGQPPP